MDMLQATNKPSQKRKEPLWYIKIKIKLDPLQRFAFLFDLPPPARRASSNKYICQIDSCARTSPGFLVSDFLYV